MASESSFVSNLNCRNVVAVRWDSDVTNGVVPTSAAVIQFIKHVGYKVGDTERIRCTPCPADPDQFVILPMETEEEAKRICHDSDTKGFGINSTRITINRLIGPNGVRIRDVTDCMRIWHEHFDNSELIDVLLGLIAMEVPERIENAVRGFEIICAAVAELVENGYSKVFGSYASKIRRNGYSDVDVCVEALPPADNSGSTVCRSPQAILDNPGCLAAQKLTKAEFNTFSSLEIIKILYRIVSENSTFKENFEMAYIPARTPLLTFKMSKNGMNIFFDVSVNNEAGIQKAALLDQFIVADKSENQKMRRAIAFVLFWAKANGLMNGTYPEEKIETKTGFNSYVITHLIIHFVQAMVSKDLVFPQAKVPVVEYNFDEIFNSDYIVFLKEFFKYYASFDFTNKVIYGRKVMQKVTVENVHSAAKSPLMLMDPLDYTHNISANVSEDSIKLLNGLIRNALFILKQKIFRVSLLLRTNHTANMLMRNKDSHTCMTTNKLPAALSQFASVCSGHQEYLTFQLPDLVRTSEEFMLLLTRILRFDVSPDHEGPSVNNLYNNMGVIFVIHVRSWIGRRNKKRKLKHVKRDTTNLELEVWCSDSYQFEEESIATLRVAMSDLQDTNRKIVYVEMLNGQVTDVRDAMHWLIDQFMANNLMELYDKGVMSIEDIPNNQHS